MARAVLVRLPPSPPGLICTLIVGQSRPGVHTGSEATVQVSRPLLPVVPFVATRLQVNPVAALGVVASETRPPAGPTVLLMRLLKSSSSVTFNAGAAVAGAGRGRFATSKLKVWTAPTASV